MASSRAVQQNRIPFMSMIVGSVISVLISITIIMVLSYLALQGNIKESAIGISVYAATFVAVFIAVWLTGKNSANQIILSAGITGMYLLILVCANIVFYNGRFENISQVVFTAAIGGALGVLLRCRRAQKRVRSKYRYR